MTPNLERYKITSGSAKGSILKLNERTSAKISFWFRKDRSVNPKGVAISEYKTLQIV